MCTLLTTNNLSVGYPLKGFILFENLNLKLEKGKLVCFMGPNGVGKSTLIRTLAGLHKPIDGKIELHAENHKVLNSGVTPREISVVLTDRIGALNMTVYELVTYGRYPYLDWNIRLSEKDINIIEDSIAKIHIQHLVHKKLYELSDGQLQMTMIARALAQDTPVILLDEPTAHLDLNNRVEIMKLLRDLTRTTDKAILISTHDLDLALQTADFIWLAGKNKHMITGIPEDLVLNGTFDDIFQFKGFDLKTGKVQHKPYRNMKIHVTGEGYVYLWTKNALERNGFEVTSENAICNIVIHTHENISKWTIDKTLSFQSITDLLNHLIG